MEFSKSLVNRLNKVDAGIEFSRSLLSGIYWCCFSGLEPPENIYLKALAQLP